MTGGKREGAGRPLATDPARHNIKARLTDAQYAKWQELGGSRWLKRMIDENNLHTTPKVCIIGH